MLNNIWHSQRGGEKRWLPAAALMTIVIATSLGRTRAQSFNSGSDGSDGALTIGTNQGTVVFDPRDTARWGKVLDPDGDGVYNFTNITINSGSAIRITADKVNQPIYWLASGDVFINGAIDISGAPGNDVGELFNRRQIAMPGPGGYAGGAGGRTNSPAVPATPGDGPGGGSGGVTASGGCNNNNDGNRICGRGAAFTGNRYLIPLIGGSGGEGAVWNDNTFHGGGAGGGAILIASSTSITLNNTINAGGGPGGSNVGGGGSGGAIRLVAPTLAGGGNLNVAGGGSPAGNAVAGGPGWIRLEGFSISTNYGFGPGSAFVTRGSPVDPTTLRPGATIHVTAIDGVSVPANPTGSFVLPDATISKSGPVNVDIQATGVPPGTVVTLQVFPQTPTDLTTVNLPTAQATLAGTLQSSTATATFTFPYGFSRGYVRATWTQ